ncbi:MAG: diguanylate cyclase, partial [Lachnospiraceae bacterium]|nr:diguanylate cyclase [Lachnospiraceae bacterium]
YKADFTMIFFKISHFHLFSENYGHEWVSHLFREIAAAIQRIVGVRGIAGRLYTDHFMLVRQVESEDEVKETIAGVEKEVEMIKEIDGVPCSIFLNHSYSLFSDMKDLQVMYEKTEKMLVKD